MKLLADDSLLVRREVQRLLLVSALCFGSATWGLEAILSHVVEGEPSEPFGGVYRLVESILWIGAAAIAIRIAEAWPIENAVRDWRRAFAQLALAVALGPVWGILAYAISPYLMPWWHERGMWGVVAKEAKGALFGYGVTTVLVHVILRARRQRAREVAATAMERATAEAQLVVRKLELQPAVVLRSMDAIARMIPGDVDTANDALVALADGMRRSLRLTRVETVPLHEELDAIEDALRLRALTIGPSMRLVAARDDDAMMAHVPALFLSPLVDRLAGWASADGEAQLLAEREADRLVVCVRVPASRRAHPDVQDSAAWLTAARGRLESLYGESSSVRVHVVGDEMRLRVELAWHAPVPTAGASAG